MKNNNFTYPFIFTCLVFAITSCVSSKQHKLTQSQLQALELENTKLKSDLQQNTSKLNVLNDLETKQITELTRLKNDSNKIANQLVELKKMNADISKNNELITRKNKDLTKNNADENLRLMASFQKSQEELQKREDELKLTEKRIKAQEEKLTITTADLEKSAADLKLTQNTLVEREQRITELEKILKQKDEATAAIKKKVQDALIGFEGKGLTVTQRNGKIYVSLDESLLFASGSIQVETKGIDALKKLAKVLEQNTDINVMVEGHTDDVPMASKGDIKDNWDLSALRATSIVKIITNNSTTNPKRLIAAGRGEFLPLESNKTADMRKKNRRTEIILTPKLDELLKILEN